MLLYDNTSIVARRKVWANQKQISRFIAGFAAAFNEAQNLITRFMDESNPDLGREFENFRKKPSDYINIASILEFYHQLVICDADALWNPTVSRSRHLHAETFTLTLFVG